MANYEDDDYFANLPDDVVSDALKPPPAWPEGDNYIGTITEAVPYQGEGKPFPCVQLQVNVANPEGKTRNVRAWVLSRNPAAAGMGIQFLKSVGLTHKEYRNPGQLVGLSGKVVLERNGDYNNIKRFVAPRR